MARSPKQEVPERLASLRLPEVLPAGIDRAEAEQWLIDATSPPPPHEKSRHINARGKLIEADIFDEEVFYPRLKEESATKKKGKQKQDAASPTAPKIIGAASVHQLRNPEAENHLLAGMIAHPAAIADNIERAGLDNYAGLGQRRILKGILALIECGKPVDAILIRGLLAADRVAEDADAYLVLNRVLELEPPSPERMTEYADQVHALYIERMELSDRARIAAMAVDGSIKNGVFRGEILGIVNGLADREEKGKEPPAIRGWPEPAGEAAYHGVAGEILRAVDPVTEADPMAILFQFLTAFGNLAGRNPCHNYERDRHGMNLFMVLVGPSTIGCKGVSLNQALGVLEGCDLGAEHVWTPKTGLVSGEGLTHVVRDASHQVKSKQHQLSLGSQFDPGAEDKRALFIEREFSSVLTVRGRKGGTLTENLRLAWSGDPLGVCSKNSPTASNIHHISLIGHITPAELLAKLWGLDKENGVANRFFWICCRKSKIIPPRETPRPVNWIANGVQAKLDAAIRFARSESKKRDDLNIPLDNRTDDAIDLWEEHYPALENPGPGMLGALKARAKPLVKRIALIYSVLDRSPFIRREHLAAALACWEFNCRSIDFIFGSPDLGAESIEDRVYQAIADAGDDGIGQYEIGRRFFRGDVAKRISVLWKLVRDGRVREVIQKVSSGNEKRTYVLPRG